MKIFVPIALCLFNITLSAQQKIEKYFDHQWHECKPADASFYSVIEKTDSGWLRQDYFAHTNYLQMEGTYDDSACKVENGRFYYYYANKNLQKTGMYNHGNKQGLWLSFHINEMMEDSTNYDDGKPVGTSINWYLNGSPRYKATWQNDGTGVGIYWFDNGNPAAAGRFKNRKPYDKWQYFYPDGKLSSIEQYDDSLVDKQYFDENGTGTDTAGRDHLAIFPGGEDAWQKYLSKNLYFPNHYRIINSNKAVTVVTFIIDIDGKVKNAFVSTPFLPEFDKIALDVINHSPVWEPAIQHNRKIPFRIVQTVTFRQ